MVSDNYEKRCMYHDWFSTHDNWIMGSKRFHVKRPGRALLKGIEIFVDRTYRNDYTAYRSPKLV